MKKIFSIIGALLAGALMFSCSDQYEEEITFGTEITTSTQSLGEFAQENAEAKTLEVTANGEWMAVAPAWVEVSPAFGGEGTTTVSVRAKDNYELVEKDGELVSELGPKRSAKIQFAGEQKYDKIPVDADGDGEQDLDKDGKPVWEYLNAIAEVSLSQAGDPNKWDPAVPRPVTMQYFNEVATVGDGFTYILTGKITEVANTTYGNFYFEDETGVAYVYGLLTPDGKAQTQWAAAGLKVNDVITVQGARAEYKGDPQMSNATYISHTVGEASPIVDATVAEFLAAEKSGTQYRISGVVSSIVKAEYGNIYLKDATGEVYVYGIGAKGEFEGMGIEVGDIVTLISNRGEYDGTPQAANSTLESKIDVTAKTVAEFLETEESKKNYYMLTGTVDALKDGDQYGNFNITDESGSVYVYGLLAGWKGASKQFQSTLEATGLKAGDKLTLIGYHTSYDDADQVGGAFYFSHEAGQGGGEEPEPEPEITYITIAEAIASTDAFAAGTHIKAVITSNRELGNLTSKKNFYVQDASGALGMRFNNDHEFNKGDELDIDVSGLKISQYNGATQLSGIDNAKTTVVSTGNNVEATTITVAQLVSNAYESQYVAIEGVQVVEAELTNTWVMGGAHTSITMENATGENFVVFSSKYATNGAEVVPQGSGVLKGIASVNNDVYQLILTSTDDYAAMTGERLGGNNEGGDTTGNVLAWGQEAFGDIFVNALAESDSEVNAGNIMTAMTPIEGKLAVSEDGFTYNGLNYSLGGGKFKFGKNQSISNPDGDKETRFQFGGSGKLADMKNILYFEAPAAGTMKIDAVGSNAKDVRTLVVATDNDELGQFEIALQGAEADGEIITVDCSTVAAGEKIYLYSKSGNINIFNIEYAY